MHVPTMPPLPLPNELDPARRTGGEWAWLTDWFLPASHAVVRGVTWDDSDDAGDLAGEP